MMRRLAQLIAAGLATTLPHSAGAFSTHPTLTNRALVEMTEISGVSVSPDGRWAVFRADRPSIDRNTVSLDWYAVHTDGGAPAGLLASGGGPIWNGGGVLTSEAPVWSEDSQSIYFRALVGGSVQVWRADLASRTSTQITHDDADVLRFRLADAGRSMIFEIESADRADIRAAEQREYREGIRIDRHIEPGRSLYQSNDVNGRLASERIKNPWFTTTHVLGERPSRLRRIKLSDLAAPPQNLDGSTKFEEDVPGMSNPADHDRLIRPSGPEVLFIRDWGEKSELRWASNASSKNSAQCVAAACKRILSAQWRGSQPEIIFTARSPDYSETLFGWNIKTNRVRRIFGASSLRAAMDDGCAIAEALALCVVSSGSQPPELRSISLADGRARTVFEPNRSLSQSIKVDARWISWPISGGRRVWAQWLAPKSSKPLPLFVHYYDCRGFLKGGTGDMWPFHTIALAGIAVLCVQQVQASPDQADGSDNVAEYRLGSEAVLGGIATLAARGLVDPSRVGMGGLSFGSEVAMWIAMNSNALAATSIASPTLDAATYYYWNDLPGRDFGEMLKSFWALPSPEEDPQRWKMLSAVLNVEKFDAPLLLQMPEQEFRYNMRLYSALLKKGRAADFYVFPHERHIIAQPAHRLAIYNRNIDWFRFWLKGEEDPEMSKKQLYENWRKLRSDHCRAIGQKKAFCQMSGAPVDGL